MHLSNKSKLPNILTCASWRTIHVRLLTHQKTREFPADPVRQSIAIPEKVKGFDSFFFCPRNFRVQNIEVQIWGLIISRGEGDSLPLLVSVTTGHFLLPSSKGTVTQLPNTKKTTFFAPSSEFSNNRLFARACSFQ